VEEKYFFDFEQGLWQFRRKFFGDLRAGSFAILEGIMQFFRASSSAFLMVLEQVIWYHAQ